MADQKDSKGGVFRRLGSAVENILFTHEEVSEEQTPETTEADTAQQSQISAPQVTQTVIQKPSARTGSSVKADENLVNAILQATTELGVALNNFESFVKTFDGIIPDEASRFKAAFAAAKKSAPLTVKELLAAADEQIGALKTEKADFLASIKTKNEEVEQLKVDMTHIDEQIVDLKRQIQELENSKQTKTELSKRLTENIKRGSEKFDLAMTAVQEILVAKKNKLLTYLKNM
jgi:chromosome segregation ATPase